VSLDYLRDRSVSIVVGVSRHVLSPPRIRQVQSAAVTGETGIGSHTIPEPKELFLQTGSLAREEEEEEGEEDKSTDATKNGKDEVKKVEQGVVEAETVKLEATVKPHGTGDRVPSTIDVIHTTVKNRVYGKKVQHMKPSDDGICRHFWTFDDDPDVDVSVYFDDFYSIMDTAMIAKKVVLVNCEKGISRSVTLAAAFMMTAVMRGRIRQSSFNLKTLVRTRDLATRVLAFIVRKRDIANPNLGFREHLTRLQQRLFDAYESAIDV
jgi:hypothetical protein